MVFIFDRSLVIWDDAPIQFDRPGRARRFFAVTSNSCITSHAKCRQKRPIQGARKVTTKKGRPAIEGTCAVCDTKLFRFIAREKENLSGEG